MLSGTYRPLNFENAFVASKLVKWYTTDPYLPCGHFLLTWHCYVTKKYAPSPLTEVLAVKDNKGNIDG